MEFVGKTFKKEFKGFGVFSGTVTSYNESSGFFKIVYEDGDSEELEFAELAALLEEKPADLVDHKPRRESKPKKRRRAEVEDQGEGGSANSNSLDKVIGEIGVSVVVDVNETHCNNRDLGSLDVDLNNSLEKEDGVVENVRESGAVNGKVSVEKDFDLNAKYNLNLNEEFVFIEEDSLNGNCQGSPKRQKHIDLNLDVNGDIDEHLKGFNMGCEVKSTPKRKCEFDLNLVIDEEIKEDMDVVCIGQVKESTSFDYVMEENQKIDKASGAVGRIHGEGAISNGTLDTCIYTGSCQGSAEGVQKEDTVSGEEGIRACDFVEVMDAREVKEENSLANDRNAGEISTPNEAGGSWRRRRKVADTPETVVSMNANDVKEENSLANDRNPGEISTPNEAGSSRRRRRRVADTPETVVSMNANDVKEDKTMVVDGSQAIVGSLYTEVSGSRRKRRNLLDNANSVPETTVLRRSTRRGSVKNNVAAAMTSSVADDLPMSSTVSALTVEKPVKSRRRWQEEPVVIPPKVQLPPSSEKLNLGGNSIPVIDLFSVYALLRSFSTLLFLSPFELDEFVDALKSCFPNTLIDSIHVSILQILRKHLEQLSNEGSESASNCLRSLNWDLLDLITWPIFMVEYLLIHGTTAFDLSSLKLFTSDYYRKPVSLKVEILKCLCDDMMEVEAIRSELSRRSSGVEMDVDFDRNAIPRACKKRKCMLDDVGGSCSPEEGADNTTDWNSDECCLCKMDGSLICCDGCPAAYHSKCVGVSNNSLPEGKWYCPECVIDRHKPWTRSLRSLRGADLLGVDPHGRLYFSSCGFLLVSDSCDSEFSFNYYDRDDLNAVVQVLKSSEVSYTSILEAIYKHWDIPVGLYGINSNMNSINLSVCLDTCMPPTALASSETCITKNEISEEGKANERPVTGCSGNLDADISKFVSPTCMSSEGSAETTQMSSGNQNCQKEGPDSCHRSADVSNESETLGELLPLGDNSLTSAGLNAKQNNPESAANGHTSSPANITELESLHVQPIINYVNYYSFGRIASLVEEEFRKSSDKAIESTIKSAEEIISAQMKIISKKFSKFCWANIPNMIADVQREKCGWCFSCRYPTDDLDCLFNMILGPVKKGSANEVVGLQSNRKSQGHLMDVICHILLIEDRLQGLLLGPWINPHYARVWHKSVTEAPDIASAKCLLLTLESNLHCLALSSEWLKHVDSAFAVGSASQVVIASSRSSKNGIGRKRSRNSESESNPSSNCASGLSMFWWRGGRLSRQLFSWKVLPHSLVSKAARQGGCTKIRGILYSENSDFVKRSKYVAWRAAVESSKTVEQLALQVRELDLNIRWDAIENTHPLPMLDKEFRNSSRLFKKAIIRRKCMEGEGAKYLLDFGKRKIIPKVVSKNGSVVVEPSSERKKYWMHESYVPLHLLKSFEEKRMARKSSKTSPGKLFEAGRIIKKLPKEKGFSYLFAKAERLEYHQCGHCKKDVLIREAASCQYCKGFFHKRHVRKSAGSIIADCVYTCHRCADEKYVKNEPKAGNLTTKRGKNAKSAKIKPQKSGKASTGKPGQLRKGKKSRASRPLRSQKGKKVVVVVPLRRSARKAKYNSLLSRNVGGRKKGKAKSGKGVNKKSKKGTLPKKSALPKNNTPPLIEDTPPLKEDTPPPKEDTPSPKEDTSPPKEDIVQRNKRTQACSSYWLNGLLLSRKPDDERVMHFRRKSFLAPFESVIHSQPKCHLCCEPQYTSTSSYISCEICGEWFHGDAFGLNVENIPMLIGFRCHVCRERTAPACLCIPATINHEAILAEVQKNSGIESSEELAKAFSPPAEINSVPESCSKEDQGLVPVDDCMHEDEQLGATLVSNQSFVSESKLEAEREHLDAIGKEKTDEIQSSNQHLKPDLLTSSDVNQLSEKKNVKSGGDDTVT